MTKEYFETKINELERKYEREGNKDCQDKQNYEEFFRNLKNIISNLDFYKNSEYIEDITKALNLFEKTPRCLESDENKKRDLSFEEAVKNSCIGMQVNVLVSTIYINLMSKESQKLDDEYEELLKQMEKN